MEQDLIQYSTLRSLSEKTGQGHVDSIFDNIQTTLLRYKRHLKNQRHLTPRDKRETYATLFENADNVVEKIKTVIIDKDKPFNLKRFEENAKDIERTVENGRVGKMALVPQWMLVAFNTKMKDQCDTISKRETPVPS